MPPVLTTKVQSRHELERFLAFPWQIYRTDRDWVPPLLSDQRALLKPNGVFLEHADGAFFLVERAGKILGRMAAFVDDTVAEGNVGIIGFFESVDDQKVASILFEKAEAWLADRGKTVVRGPLSPSLAGQVGVQLEGTPGSPTLLMAYNPPYYRRLFETNGYGKGRDFLAYELDHRSLDARKVSHLNDKLTRAGFRFRNIRPRHLAADMRAFRELHNDSWKHANHYAYSPLTEREIEHSLGSLKAIGDWDLIVLVERNGQLVGGVVALPDANPALQCLNGRLGPIRIMRCLWALRQIKRIRIVDVVVSPSCQGHGLATAMIARSINAALAKGYTSFEYSWVVEDNLPSRGIADRFHGRMTHRYRVYEKSIV